MKTLKTLLVFAAVAIAFHPSRANAQSSRENNGDWRAVTKSVAPNAGPATTTDEDPAWAQSNSTSGDSSADSNSNSSSWPTAATGTISGLASGADTGMKLTLSPRQNGLIHGELVIQQSDFGTAEIKGFVRGPMIQFQVPYGDEIYFFSGRRHYDQISGDFESSSAQERGKWTVQAN